MITRTRIAPTPSGFLHEGNGCNFIYAAVLAKAYNIPLFLRIDDLDELRFRDVYLEDIFETLQWLGIRWDEGPKDKSDFYSNWKQRMRIQAYKSIFERLIETADVYTCICSRSQFQNYQAAQIDCPCFRRRDRYDLPGSVVRMRIPEDFAIIYSEKGNRQSIKPADYINDVIIWQRNGMPSYQITSLADDIAYQVDCIVRGNDLLPSTAVQLYLAAILNEQKFLHSTFHHHPIVMDRFGQKMSKSKGADSLKSRRTDGDQPTDLYRTVAQWLNLSVKELNNSGPLNSADIISKLACQYLSSCG